MVDKTLSLLGIAKKAGLLAVGSESAAISARHGKAQLIISASDASPGTVRRAKANAGAAGLRYYAVPYTKFELGKITGRGSPGVLAILDKGLADGFLEKLASAPAGRLVKQATGRPAKQAETTTTGKESDV